jgi:hypothetical protein
MYNGFILNVGRQAMAQTRADNIFWIFPLTGDGEPYSKQIDTLGKYFAKDEIVIPADILASYKAKPNEERPQYSFNDLRANHQNTLQFVVIKEMDEPLGKGAFAGSTGIRTHAFMLYSGIYGSREDFGKLDVSQQIYLGQIDKNNLIDSRTMVNKTRYIQHLPELTEDKAFYEKLNQPIAYANLEYADIKFYVELNGQLYIIPAGGLVTIRVIEANEVLGYSYGANYWLALKVTPSLLRSDGKPIDRVTIGVYENKDKHLRFSLSRERLEIFAKQRFIKNDENILMILPQYPKELTVGKANGAFLPVMYYVLNLTHDGFIGVVEGKDVVVFKMIEPTLGQAQELHEFCQKTKIKLMLLPEGDKTKGMIPINDFVNLSLKNIKRAFEILNALVLDKDKFKFVIVENKGMRKDSVPVGTQGLFGKSNSPVVETLSSGGTTLSSGDTTLSSCGLSAG